MRRLRLRTMPSTSTHQSPSSKTVFSNTVFVFLGEASIAITQALVAVSLLVLLDKREYGIFTAAIAWIDPFRAAAIFGLDSIGLRRAAAKPTDLMHVVGTLMTTRLMTGSIAFVIAVGMAFTVRGSSESGSWIGAAAALAVLSSSVFRPVQVAYQARHLNKRIAWAPAIGGLIQLCIIGILWLVRAPLIYFVGATAIADAIGAAIVLTLLHREVGYLPFEMNRKLAKSLVQEAAPVGYMQFVVMLYKRFGYYFVEAYKGLAAVGGLGAATQIASPVNAIASALAISVNPYAASLTAGRKFDELGTFFRTVLRKAIVVLIPISTVTALLADPVARALNPEYLDAAAAYRWLTFAVIWMFICQVSTAVLIGMGHARLMAIIVTVDLVAYTGLAYWLVPLYGPEGAAMATFFQEMLNAGMQVSCVLWVIPRASRRGPHAPEGLE